MKKSRKMRGHRTHGHGKKAARGAGLRGGRGNAGIHKHRYVKAIKSGRVFGGRGFCSIKKREEETINVGDLPSLMNDKDVLDLSSHGIDKLLGAGSIGGGVEGKEIRVRSASAKAREKVKEAGARLVIKDA